MSGLGPLSGFKRNPALRFAALVGPGAAFIVVSLLLPLLSIVVFSFWRTESYELHADWNLDNYRTLLGEAAYRIFFLRSLVTAVLVTLVCVVCGWPVAYFIARHGGRYRLLLVLALAAPFFTGAILRITALQGLLGPIGLINMALSLFGVSDLPKWLVSSRWAMWAVITVSVWQGLGYSMVLFLAGLQNIRKDLYEAAALDGATGWTRFWYITLPLLSPMTFFVLIISIIGSFQVFELVYVMTKAGPSNATNTLVYFIYQNGFSFYQMGTASAAAMVLFLIVLTLTLVQYRLQNRWVHYE